MCVFFVIYIEYFPYCLFVSNSQVIGCKDRLRNDLYCVGWGVKLYSFQSTLWHGQRLNASIFDHCHLSQFYKDTGEPSLPVQEFNPMVCSFASRPPLLDSGLKLKFRSPSLHQHRSQRFNPLGHRNTCRYLHFCKFWGHSRLMVMDCHKKSLVVITNCNLDYYFSVCGKKSIKVLFAIFLAVIRNIEVTKTLYLS